MSAHRELQRTLFRMQADDEFAQAVLSGDAAALESTGLGAEDHGLLRDLDARALRADPGGKRRAQIAGNAASEYFLTLAAAAREEHGAALLGGFLTSDEFHRAMAANGRLPLAFGAYAERYARQGASAVLLALASLEHGMARVRRAARRPAPALAAGEVQLARSAATLELAAGTLAVSAALRAALDAGETAPASQVSPTETETLLLFAGGEPDPHRLGDVRLELLEPPADELMRRAAEPFSRAARAGFARESGAEPEDLEAFLAPFLGEGVLVAGSG